MKTALEIHTDEDVRALDSALGSYLAQIEIRTEGLYTAINRIQDPILKPLLHDKFTIIKNHYEKSKLEYSNSFSKIYKRYKKKQKELRLEELEEIAKKTNQLLRVLTQSGIIAYTVFKDKEEIK